MQYKHNNHEVNSKPKILEQKGIAFIKQLDNFSHKQITTVLLLGVATLFALIMANLPWKNPVDIINKMEIGFLANHSHFTLPVGEWIGSGLMTVFFFIIGLEIKREILAGKLKDFRYIATIFISSIGGMIIPAIIYFVINYSKVGQHGWAIPMVTDTAFAIGVLSILAKRVSQTISVFLAALAIFDDIFAIIIISIFYTEHLQYAALLKCLIPLGLLIVANRAGVSNGWIYILLGVVFWYFIHGSGIHATLAGLVVAFTIPVKTYLTQNDLVNSIRGLLRVFESNIKDQNSMLSSEGQHSLTEKIHSTVNECSTPLQRWEQVFIIPIIIVLPIFALFNAGIVLSQKTIVDAFYSPVTWGIIVGLVIGKPIGVTLFGFLSLWLKIGKIPLGMTSIEIIGVGLLAGIGFTMSLFITGFAFAAHPELVKFAKFGILIASLVSTLLALVWPYYLSATKIKNIKNVIKK